MGVQLVSLETELVCAIQIVQAPILMLNPQVLDATFLAQQDLLSKQEFHLAHFHLDQQEDVQLLFLGLSQLALLPMYREVLPKWQHVLMIRKKMLLYATLNVIQAT